MRKITLALTFTLFASTLNAAPIASSTRNYSVMISPLSILGAQAAGSLGFAASDNIAITVPFRIGPTYDSKFELGNQSYQVSLPGWLVEAGVGARVFLSNGVFNSGWFIHPDLVISYFYNTTASSNNITLKPEFTGGYAWIWDSGFSLNLGLGVWVSYDALGKGPFYNPFNQPPATKNTPFNGGLTGELAIGYTW